MNRKTEGLSSDFYGDASDDVKELGCSESSIGGSAPSPPHTHTLSTTACTPVVAGGHAVTITLPLIRDQKAELSSKR